MSDAKSGGAATAVDAGTNVGARMSYEDMREWIVEADGPSSGIDVQTLGRNHHAHLATAQQESSIVGPEGDVFVADAITAMRQPVADQERLLALAAHVGSEMNDVMQARCRADALRMTDDRRNP